MRFLRALKMCVLVLAVVAVVSLVVERLWNWLMPSIFGLHAITYWQALGLLVLSKLLLGGFHKHGPRGGWNRRREWKRRMQARWSTMTPEERERFREGMKQYKNEWKSRWHCGADRQDAPNARPAAATEREA